MTLDELKEKGYTSVGFRKLGKNGNGFVYIKKVDELTDDDFNNMVYVRLSGGTVPEYNSREYIEYYAELKNIELK